MKSKSRNLILLAASVILTIVLSSCGNDYTINPTKYAKIYMPQARQVHKNGVKLKDTTYIYIYGAAYAGPSQAPHDIQVKFSVNPALVDSFNNKNLRSYLLMPQGSYSLGKTTAVIPAGEKATQPLKLTVNVHGYIKGGEKTYLLPITMKETGNSVKVNKDLETAYFLFHGPNLKIIKSGWSIIDYTGAYNNAYGPRFIIDGDDNSFWLIVAPLPWYFTIDMGKNH